VFAVPSIRIEAIGETVEGGDRHLSLHDSICRTSRRSAARQLTSQQRDSF
jgi:hypothetical protein